jgi:hypothetical protein
MLQPRWVGILQNVQPTEIDYAVCHCNGFRSMRDNYCGDAERLNGRVHESLTDRIKVARGLI